MSGTVPGIILVIATLLVAGCTGTGAPSPQAFPEGGVLSVQPDNAPRFSAGDVVRLPGGDPNAGMLILGYEPETDLYDARGVGRIYYAYGAEDGIWIWLDVRGNYPRELVDTYSVGGDRIPDMATIRDTP